MALFSAIFSSVCRSTRKVKPLPVLKNINRKCHTVKAKEVVIETPVGKIAGKWWGDDTVQPILSIHGWQDNAGTWDRLAPLMPADCPVLAIDLPGHGRSSWIPRGLIYDNWLFVKTVRDIVQHYEWQKVSFLSHSMGSIISFFYSAIYPETVNFYIAIENIVPDIESSSEKIYKEIGNRIKALSIDENRLDIEPPSYSYEEAVMRWHLGTGKSVTLDSAPYLVDRGSLKSKADPNKYYFCRDPRMKHKVFLPPEPDFIYSGIKRLKFPMLYLKGADSLYASDALSVTSRDLLAEANPKYEYHRLPGTHHLHLNNADTVAPVIKQFLEKYNFTLDYFYRP